MVSFKIFKKGTRYKPIPSTVKKAEDGGDLHNLSTGKSNGDLSKRLVDDGEAEHNNTNMPVSKTCSTQLELPGLEEYDISFTLSLFQDGYLVRKSTEMENFKTPQQDDKSLHPYDKASEELFSAIQTGLLPGDMLDDIPSNYINGVVVCEIRDYRKCNLEQGTINYASSGCAASKVRLRMSLENIVKDIPQLADDSWTYRDLLEVESRIVKVMQPELVLSPTPKLDRLCSDPCPDKLNLGIERKRPLRNPEVAATTMRKRICGNEVSNTDKLNSEDQGIVSNNAMILSMQDPNGSLSSASNNFVQQPSSRSTLSSQPQGKIQVPNFSGANTSVSGVQNLSGSYSDIINGSVNSLGKRENPDSQMPTLHSLKRAKPNLGGLDGIQQQQYNTQFVNQNIQDMNLKNQLMRSQLEANGTQYNASRYPSNVITSQDTNNFYFNQPGMRPVKMEQIDLMRNPIPSAMQWPNSNKDVLRKDDMLQKKKSLPSPRVSSGMVHSPVSSKSGEISSGSGALGSQKATLNSNAAIGMASAASSPNDSVQRQQQTQVKRKSNSASKTQIMSGVGSPASVSTMNAPISATSPSTTNVPVDDQPERFAKLVMLTQRFLANTKRKKDDQFPSKRNIGHLTHRVASCLNDAFGAEDFTDEMRPMSRSFVGGNINACKARVMIFSRTESNQDVVNRRLGMTEKQSDGTVLMQYGDADGPKFPSLYDPFLMLPNVHYADLLAAQFTKLIVKEKYQKTDDQVHPVSFYNTIPVPQNEMASELQQESAQAAQGQPQPNMLAQSHPSNVSNSNPQMLASRNNPALPMAQNYFSRAQQFDQSSLQQQLLHQQQQQPQQQQQQQPPQQQQQSQLQLPQLPRSNSPMLSQNPLTQLMGPNANLGSLNLNSLMTNKTTAQQLHLLTQQQNNPMHRKMMPGPNNMGNLGMVGLGSNINNIMGMSGIRPMQSMSGIRPMQSVSGGVRQPMSQDQAAAIQRMKMQSRMGAGVYGGIPTSMLGPAMNRISLNPQLQRNAMASMGPPKNFYQQQMAPQQMAQQQLSSQQMSSQLTQQQLSSQQMSSQLTQQQMSQQQMSQQQQMSSPLQQQTQMGSPSVAMSPQQMSNGNNNMNSNMNNGNIGGNVGVLGPGSPQLSSQTLGSIGSISSPMDMQGPK